MVLMAATLKSVTLLFHPISMLQTILDTTTALLLHYLLSLVCSQWLAFYHSAELHCLSASVGILPAFCQWANPQCCKECASNLVWSPVKRRTKKLQPRERLFVDVKEISEANVSASGVLLLLLGLNDEEQDGPLKKRGRQAGRQAHTTRLPGTGLYIQGKAIDCLGQAKAGRFDPGKFYCEFWR